MANYTREVQPPPAQISTNGHCAMGTFNAPIPNVNLLDLHRPLGFSAPRAFNAFRLKEWMAFQIANDDWFICLSVYNTKSVGIAIVMAYNKAEQRMYRYEHKVPCWRLQVPRGLLNSHCYYHSSNFSIDIKNRLETNRFEISVSARNFSDVPDFTAQWTAHHTTEPSVIVQPFAQNRPLYSHKALMPVDGTANFGDKVSVFTSRDSCAIVDDHKGFYPYVMQYDWVTALGFDENRRLVGFNLTDNQIQNPERYNENCLWQDAKMIPLPPISVSRPNGVSGTWEIRDQYGLVELSFTPLADVPTYLNVGFAAFKYNGPTGKFAGSITNPSSDKVLFSDFIGMGEKKFIRM